VQLHVFHFAFEAAFVHLIALALCNFAIGTQAYAFAGLLQVIATDLGVGVAIVGQLQTAFALTFAIASPVLVALFAVRERRMLLMAGLAVLALANGFAALAPTFETSLVLRIVAGLGAGVVGPIASAVAADLAPPEQRGRALGLVFAGLTLAFIIGIPAGSVIGGLLTWRATFAFAAAIAVVALVAVLLLVPVVPARGVSGLSPKAAITPTTLHTYVLTFLCLAATFSTVAYIGPVVTAVTGGSAQDVAKYQVWVGVGSMVGIPVGAMLADRGLARPTLVAAFAGMAITQLGYTLMQGGVIPPSPSGLSVLIFLGAASAFTIPPVTQTRLVAIAGAAAPIALALNGSVNFLGQGAGAVTGGLTIVASSLTYVGITGAVLALLGLLLALALGAAPTPRAAQPQKGPS
jgi:DHA1 family inner membrane transport protein